MSNHKGAIQEARQSDQVCQILGYQSGSKFGKIHLTMPDRLTVGQRILDPFI